MKLSTFIKRSCPLSDAAMAFFRAPLGQRYAELELEAFAQKFTYFKRDVSKFAESLHGGARLDLYQGISDLTAALKDRGFSVTYDLSRSFLGSAEVDLLILKAMQSPMTQEELAEMLRCSPTAANDRISSLRDGMSLADMKVRISPEYGGRLESTVHPVLLPLNLSEAYFLVSLLGKTANELDRCDPHGAVARDLCEKVYFQLTDYARERIDGKLAQQGVVGLKGAPPVFNGDGRSNRSSNWIYLEKSGTPVKVTRNDPELGITVSVGTLASWEDPADYAELLGERNPASCFVLKGGDGSREVLSWADVVDIEKALQGGA